MVSVNRIVYSLFNPSISDYIINLYGNDSGKLFKIFNSVRTIDSLRTLSNLHKNNFVSDKNFQTILFSLLFETESQKEVENDDYNYYLFLIKILLGKDWLVESQIQLITNVINGILSNPIALSSLSEFADILFFLYEKELIHDVNTHSMVKILGSINDNQEDLNAAMALIDFFKIDDADLIDDINQGVHIYLVDSLINACADIDISEFINTCYDEFRPEPDFDEARISNAIASELRKLICTLEICEGVEIDEDEIISNCAPETLVEEYLSRMRDEEHFEYYSRGSHSGNGNIDDLFDRSGQ